MCPCNISEWCQHYSCSDDITLMVQIVRYDNLNWKNPSSNFATSKTTQFELSLQDMLMFTQAFILLHSAKNSQIVPEAQNSNFSHIHTILHGMQAIISDTKITVTTCKGTFNLTQFSTVLQLRIQITLRN